MHASNSRFTAVLLLLCFCAGCQEQTSGITFEPEITGHLSGVFSYDIALKLKAIHRNDWTRGADGNTDSQTTVEGYLSDVSLDVTVLYSQGENLETTAFKSRWDPMFDIVVNVPKQARIEGYDIKGDAYIFDLNDQFVSKIKIASSFRY